jgi:hypothetical protein
MFAKVAFLGRSRQPVTPLESVYFYTLHKCASALFSDYVLKHVRGLRLVDYADQFYKGLLVENVTFEERGFVYGPIRLSTGPPSTEYSRLVEPVSSTDFVRDKLAIFVIRDPRDILVSAYYSFGYSHGFSEEKEIQEQQQRVREAIQSKTIDDYVLEIAPWMLTHFQTVDRLAQACERGIVLKYEDMVNNWDKFSSELTRYLDLGRKTLRRGYKQSRPRKKEDLTSHRRFGKTGAYKEKLLPSTVNGLNLIFAPVLTRFQYET